jgi:hypothetical protein
MLASGNSMVVEHQPHYPKVKVSNQAWARLPFQRKWTGQNGTGWDGTRLNGNCIGFKNTVDYHSWMVNEIHQYHSQQTWMVFTVEDWS